jgi:hypothetical protein
MNSHESARRFAKAKRRQSASTVAWHSSNKKPGGAKGEAGLAGVFS